MFLFLLTHLIAPAQAAVCSFRNLAIDQPKLIRYAADSEFLTTPKRFRTEANPEFAPDNPTTYWALPTAGSTIEVKVRRAAPVSSAPGPIQITWIETTIIIDPATNTVSGEDECDVLHPVTVHVLEILKVIQESGEPK